MNEACEIVRFRPEHADAVAQLQTALWSPDPAANRRYLAWKYEQNPWADEPPHIYLALREGQLVGMRGFYASRWEVGVPGEAISIPLADDAVIAPEERKRGLFAQILRAAIADLAEAGYEYVFSLSAGMMTMMSSLALGWKSAGRLEPLAHRAPDFDRHARLRARLKSSRVLWRYSDAALFRSADERRPFRTLDTARPRAGIEIARAPRPDAMAELYAQRPRDGRLRHTRTTAHLTWRFANPMHEYRFLYATRGGRLAGYLVLRARAMSLYPTPRVCIADLEASEPDVRAALLGAAVDAGTFAELIAWSAGLTAGECALLRERGFAPLDPERNARGWPCVLVRATRGDAPWSLGGRSLVDPASWDVRMLDSMAG